MNKSIPPKGNRFAALRKVFFMLPALLASCAGNSENRILPDAAPAGSVSSVPYNITDYRNKAEEGTIPEWLSLYLEGGAERIEARYAFRDYYVFISRNEGGSLPALQLWAEGFSPALDFPRLAAARIDSRLSNGIQFPDEEYGPFYETLVRAASDAVWTGAERADDFWVRKKEIPYEDETADDMPFPEANEFWEYFILVTIEKSAFTAQVDTLFLNIKQPSESSKKQIAAAARIKARFFEGF